VSNMIYSVVVDQSAMALRSEWLEAYYERIE
jgi:hypothetical protein